MRSIGTTEPLLSLARPPMSQNQRKAMACVDRGSARSQPGGAALRLMRRRRIICPMKHSAVLGLCMLLAACAHTPVEQPPAQLFSDHLFAAPSERISAEDVFALSDAMKRYLETEMAGALLRKGLHKGLIDALYSKNQLKLEYDGAVTRNASQAFEARSGNCLSLVIMTAAFAKALGLSVEYQSAFIDPTWSRVGGMYFVSGNHEEFTNRNKFLEAIGSTGIHVLNNEKVDVDGLQIVGVHDDEAGDPKALRAILQSMQLGGRRPSVLLAHQPSNPVIAAEAGISLQLSGHTHGGQIWPWSWVAALVHGRFNYGLHRLGALQVFTSSGVGTWGMPMRVGTKSEIVLLRFEAAEKEQR